KLCGSGNLGLSRRVGQDEPSRADRKSLIRGWFAGGSEDSRCLLEAGLPLLAISSPPQIPTIHHS
ncbi:MAG TPA: hypothetical protein VLC12_14975, partial [Terriglobales bacterium]|nr:hypothetical protein [Terriglobales bacterium]